MEIFLKQLKDGEVNKNSTRLKHKVEEWPNFQIKKKNKVNCNAYTSRAKLMEKPRICKTWI